MSQTSVRRSDPSSIAALTSISFACTRTPGRMGADWIHLTGELDLSNAAVVSEQLEEAQASSYMVVVDLRELEFIDCAGLRLLVTASTHARNTQKSLVLVRGNGQVGRMLDMTGLHEELDVVDPHALHGELGGADPDALREGLDVVDPHAQQPAKPIPEAG